MKCKLKLQEWSKLIAGKKSLIIIIYGQCDDATRTEIALGDDYKVIHANAELIRFLAIVQTVAKETTMENYCSSHTRMLWS